MNNPSTSDIISYVFIGVGVAFLIISLIGAFYYSNLVDNMANGTKSYSGGYTIEMAKKSRKDTIETAIFGAVIMLVGIIVKIAFLFY